MTTAGADLFASAVEARNEVAKAHARQLQIAKRNYELARERGPLTEEELASIETTLETQPAPPPLPSSFAPPPGDLRAIILSTLYGRGVTLSSDEPSVAAATTAAAAQKKKRKKKKKTKKNAAVAMEVVADVADAPRPAKKLSDYHRRRYGGKKPAASASASASASPASE